MTEAVQSLYDVYTGLQYNKFQTALMFVLTVTSEELDWLWFQMLRYGY